MKKLYLLGFLLFFGSNIFAQCGVTSAISPKVDQPYYGSYFQAVPLVLSGWVVDSLIWERNGVIELAGIQTSLNNTTSGYANVCLTVTAHDSTTGDTCRSKYCQLFYVAPYSNSLSSYITVDSLAPLTLNIHGYFCSSIYFSNLLFNLDFGDGTSTGYYMGTHTYTVPGTYIVTFTTLDGGGFTLSTVTRKVYVGNGHKNFFCYSWYNSAACFSINSGLSSTPAYLGSYLSTYSPMFSGGITMGPSGVGSPRSFYGTGIDMLTYTAYDSLGNSFRSCNLVAIPDCKVAPDTMSGTIWLDADADGIWDAGELPYSGNTKVKMSYGSYESVSDNSGNYIFPVPQTPSYVYLSNLPQNFLVTFPSSNGHYNHFTNSSMHPGYHFGVVDRGVNLCGKAYIDINSNGVYDATPDINYNSVLVNAYNTALNKTFTTSTDQNGNYCIALPVGNYVLKAYGINLDSSTVVPDSIIVNAPAPGSFYNNNFGFQTQVVGGNLGIFLNVGGMPRPGFTYSLTGSVVNSGVDTSSGNVVINYSPTLIYINSTLGGVHNATNKTITWPTGLIPPTGSKYFSANFTVPVATPLGTLLVSSSTVTTGATYTDYDLTNNSSSRSSFVVGSFDPNDKQVVPRGVGTGGNVLHSQRMYYRINFQNTGTASAINIIVQDEINPNLDMNTFRMERASHNFTRVITGNNITWKFFNINLPDSNTNEPLSHGYIEFSIKPKQGLPDGTVIANSADIYFDFNPPIVTNIVSNILQSVNTGIYDSEEEASISIYPNPFDDELILKQQDIREKIVSISIYDVFGKLIYNSDSLSFIDGISIVKIPEIASALYFVKMQIGKKSITCKMIKR
jgi:hypothetical protein